MTKGNIEPTQQTAARIAGLAFLIPFAILMFAYAGIDARLIVAGDAAQTAQNILTHTQLFRLGIACDVLYGAGTLVLLTALYRVMRPVNPGLALLAAFSRLIYAVIWFAIAIDHFKALEYLSGASYLSAFSTDQLQSLARLSLTSGFDTYYIGLAFFGLASTLYCVLWLKSNYIPRALAAIGLLVSVWSVVCTLTFYVYPDFDKLVGLSWFDVPMALFEVVTGFWLLIRGLR